jgi:hypothetical protein
MEVLPEPAADRCCSVQPCRRLRRSYSEQQFYSLRNVRKLRNSPGNRVRECELIGSSFAGRARGGGDGQREPLFRRQFTFRTQANEISNADDFGLHVVSDGESAIERDTLCAGDSCAPQLSFYINLPPLRVT